MQEQDVDTLGFTLAIEQDRQRENLLKSNWQVAQEGSTGDTFADHLRKAQRLGIRPEVIEDDPTIGKQADQPDWYRVREQNPALAKWMAVDDQGMGLTALDKMRLAADDHDQLGLVEGSLRSIGANVTQVLGSGAMGVGRAYDDFSLATSRLITGGLEAAGVDTTFLKQPVPDFRLSAPLKMIGQGYKAMGDAVRPDQDRLHWLSSLIGTTSQIATQAGLMMVNPTVGTAAFLGSGYDMASERVEQKRAKGLEVSEGQRLLASLSSSFIEAITERTGIDRLLERVPPMVRNSLGRAVIDLAGTAGVNFAEEYAADFLKDVSDKLIYDPQRDIWKGPQGEHVEAGAAAAILRAALIGFTKGRALQTDQERVQEYHDAMQQAGEAVRNSKVFQRNKGAMETFMQSSLETGEHTQVPLDLRNVEINLEREGHNAGEVFEQLGIADRVEQARVTGHDVEVDIAKVLTLSDQPYFDLLLGDMRQSANDMTSNEMMATAEKRMREMQAEADAMVADLQQEDAFVQSSNQVYEVIYQQQIEAGVTKEVASAFAAMNQRIIESRVAQRNLAGDPILPHELLGEGGYAGLNINQEPFHITDLASQIRRVRRGKMPTPEQAHGTSLLAWARERGVIDDGGELASRDVDVDLQPFQRRLVRDDGLTLDDVWSIAQQNGYPINSIDEFLAAVDRELGGDPVYPLEGGDPRARDELRYLEELADEMARLDPNDELSDLELARRFYATEPQGLELNQVEIDGVNAAEALADYAQRQAQLEAFIKCLTT